MLFILPLSVVRDLLPPTYKSKGDTDILEPNMCNGKPLPLLFLAYNKWSYNRKGKAFYISADKLFKVCIELQFDLEFEECTNSKYEEWKLLSQSGYYIWEQLRFYAFMHWLCLQAFF
jgi:hypothetical protein